MATETLSDFLRRLTLGMAAETLSETSDQHLVERALANRDEAAFQAMVQRHGAMVYRVCWRVLQDVPETEDAFQATFLVLAQKLRSVRKQCSLASWLHGVAHRVALKARARSAARRRHEAQAPQADATPPDDLSWKELRSVLDAELDQLPEKWRLPLVLCYLEGRTQDEAAGQLGWSKSTLRRRLTEARDALGLRLQGRGIAWPAALATILLADCIASAGPGLVTATVIAAADVAAGQAIGTTVSASAVSLAEGVLKAMFLSKLKTTAVLVAMFLAVTFLPFGSALVPSAPAEDQPAQPKRVDAEAKPRPAEPKTPAPIAKPAPILVGVFTELYEVDNAFYKKLASAKRMSQADLEEFERMFLEELIDPLRRPLKEPKAPPFDPMRKKPGKEPRIMPIERQKLVQTGQELKLLPDTEGVLLSLHTEIKCLPSPEQVKKGNKDPQKVIEGVALHATFQISSDRRYVRVKLTEKSAELEGIEKVKVIVNDTKEVQAESVFLTEVVQSRVRDIPDGGTFLLPLQYRSPSAKESDRWFVMRITPRIYIEEEEEYLRKKLQPK